LHRQNLFIFIITGVYFLLAWLLFPFVVFYIDSPDAVFYITIGKKYAAGNIMAAVNNYWSPLISWLLVPLMAVGTDPVVAFKIMQCLYGAAALILSYHVSGFMVRGATLRKLYVICLIPAFLSYALIHPTPDLLFLVMLLWLLLFFMKIHKKIKSENIEQLVSKTQWLVFGLTAGISGSLIYFAKAFGFPFFIASWTFLTAFLIFSAGSGLQKKFLLKGFVAGLCFFLLGSSVWMAMLYHKYGSFTMGYAATYNFNLIAPGSYIPGSPLKHPVLEAGLMDISSREETSAWESPGSSAVGTWSPFDSQASMQHYINILKVNARSFYYFLISRNTGLILLITVAIYFIMMRRRRAFPSPAFILVTGCMLILVAGYSLIFFMQRYLWICNMMLPLMIIHLFETVITVTGKARWLAYGMIAITFMLLVKKPVKEILFKEDAPIPVRQITDGFAHPLQTIKKTYSDDMQFPALISKLKSLNIQAGRTAGIRTLDSPETSYTKSLLVCMYLNHTFYGEISAGFIQWDQIEKYKIRYLVSWESPLQSSNADYSHLVSLKELKLLEDHTTGFTLFEIKK